MFSSTWRAPRKGFSGSDCWAPQSSPRGSAQPFPGHPVFSLEQSGQGGVCQGAGWGSLALGTYMRLGLFSGRGNTVMGGNLRSGDCSADPLCSAQLSLGE